MAKKSYANESLEQKYKRLAKQADQRLRRLENLSDTKGFENVLKRAYSKAMKSIEHWSGPGAKRFDTKAPTQERSLRAKIADIEEFLHMKTSTKAQIKKSYIKAANKTNELYGTNLTWEDLDDLYNSEEWKKLGGEDKYGSNSAILVVAQLQDDDYRKYLKKQIKDVKKGKIEKIDYNLENQKVRQKISDLVEEYGIKVVDLF